MPTPEKSNKLKSQTILLDPYLKLQEPRANTLNSEH